MIMTNMKELCQVRITTLDNKNNFKLRRVLIQLIIDMSFYIHVCISNIIQLH